MTVSFILNAGGRPCAETPLCTAEVILLMSSTNEIPNMDKGIQLSLNKTHSGDREILTDETLKTINIRLHKINGLSVFLQAILGIFYKESIFVMQC